MALRELKGKSRAFIVTDKPLYDLGFAEKVTRILDTVNVHHQVRAPWAHGGGRTVLPRGTRFGLSRGRRGKFNMCAPVFAQVFYHVAPDPTLACIREGLREILEFKPDVIIALGGGSPMDAAKVMWLMYEVPETKFEGLAMRFMDIRKRVYDLPQLGTKASMVSHPSLSPLPLALPFPSR